MDFNVQLRNLREKVAAETDELHKLVAEAEKQNRGLNDDERARYEAGEKAVEEARGRIDIMERQAKMGPHSERVNDTKLTDKEERRFSIVRLMDAMVSLKQDRNQKVIDAAGFELEVSREIESRTGRPTGGAYVPRQIFNAERRALLASVGSAGGYVVGEDFKADQFIGMLRASLAVRLGATTLPGLVGDVYIPKQTGAATHYWLASEDTDVTSSDQTFGTVRLSPKHGAAHTRFSRQLLRQSAPAIDTLVTNDLTKVVSLAADNAGLYGSGIGGSPTGLAYTTDVNDPTNFSAAIPTWAELMVMLGECALDNTIGLGGAEDGQGNGTVAWLMEGQQYSNLMAKSKDAGSGMFIVDGSGRIGPYGVGVSNNITTGDVWVGDWSQLLFATWGDPEMIVNPYTSDLNGYIRMTLHHYMDIGVRQAKAFCINNDG